MNKRIISRDDLLLAKIAGHEVDLSTMTPPSALNAKEQYLLEIADRMGNKNTDNSEKTSGVLLVKYADDGADTSIADIYSAWNAGTPVFMEYDGYIVPLSYASNRMVEFLVTTVERAGRFDFGGYNIATMVEIKGRYNPNGEEIWKVNTLETDTIPPIEIGVTHYTDDGHLNPSSITLDITAGELYNYIETGHSVKIDLLMQVGTGSYKRITSVIPIEAFCQRIGATMDESAATYFFKTRFDMSSTDILFVSEMLSENDAVVLSKIE